MPLNLSLSGYSFKTRVVWLQDATLRASGSFYFSSSYLQLLCGSSIHRSLQVDLERATSTDQKKATVVSQMLLVYILTHVQDCKKRKAQLPCFLIICSVKGREEENPPAPQQTNCLS